VQSRIDDALRSQDRTSQFHTKPAPTSFSQETDQQSANSRVEAAQTPKQTPPVISLYVTKV
jgi:hypothetical protein